jgi:ABC-2 type transport system permease protein
MSPLSSSSGELVITRPSARLQRPSTLARWRVTAVAALARRDFLLARSYRLSFVSDIGWGVLNLLVYFFISKLVDTDATSITPAPSYFSFAFCGIVMSLVIYAASTAVGYRVREDQLAGTLEALCTQPLRTFELALGVISFPLAFGVVRATGYLVLAAVALDLNAPDADWAGSLVMFVTAALAFAPIGILSIGATIVFKRATSITAVIVYAMTFVSGAVFPTSVLPDWLQSIGQLMPTWFAFEGLRNALFTGGGWYGDAGALVIFAAIGLPCSMWLLSVALAKAKRDGTLGQY